MTSDGTKTYAWDAENRLVEVKGGASTLASFAYNATGIRTRKTAGGVTATYVLEGDSVAEERLSPGGTSRHFYGPGIDRVLATIDAAGAVSYYVRDHLGSIRQRTDAWGQAVLTRDYDPWGNLVAGTAAGGWSFTGREWDPEIALYYYRARYYEPKLGRFLGQDPIWRTNPYAYVSNRPAEVLDPLGLMEVVNRIVETVVNQGDIPAGAVARTAVGRDFGCECKCDEGGSWHLTGTLTIWGTMLLPRTVTRRPHCDHGVVDTASARSHEYSWHIDPAIAAVRAEVEPVEARPFTTQQACDDECTRLKRRMPALFSRVMRRTQADEHACNR